MRCIQNGDYFIPDLGLTEQEQTPLGKYGRIRRDYLEKHRSGLYTRMILDGTLMKHVFCKTEIQNIAEVQVEKKQRHKL